MISLIALCTMVSGQPATTWTTRSVAQFEVHASSALRTNVGEMLVTFDAVRTPTDIAIQSMDMKLTCHPIHAPDAPAVAVQRGEAGKPTANQFPNNPSSIAVNYLQWIGWWSAPTLELGDTAWFDFEVEGVIGSGYQRLVKLDGSTAEVRTSLDLQFGKTPRPMTMVWTGKYDAKTGAIRQVEGEVAGVPQAEGYPLRVERVKFTLLPGKVGRVLHADCDHDGG